MGVQTVSVSLHEFFEQIFLGCPRELATTIIGFNGRDRHVFLRPFTVDAIDQMEACVDEYRNIAGINIYFRPSLIERNVLLEEIKHGRRGNEEKTAGCQYLYADLDVYCTQHSIQAALDALEGLKVSFYNPQIKQVVSRSIPPSVIWETGRGLQAAWRLSEFCTDIMKLKIRNKWLREQLGAYGADDVGDLTRVLRVPTTFNHKTSPPGQARIVQWNMHRIYHLIDDFGWSSPSDFVHGEPIESEALPQDFLEKLDRTHHYLAQRISSESSAREADARLTDGGRVNRSQNDWFIACALLRAGYRPGQVFSVLTHPTWFSGDKFREGRRYHYANDTVQRAEATIAREEQKKHVYFQQAEGKKPHFVPEWLVEAVVEDGHHLLLLSHEHEQIIENIWHYQGGVYHKTGEQFLREETLERLGTAWAPHHAEAVIKAAYASRKLPRRDIFAAQKLRTAETLWVNTLSGMVNVASGECRPHSPADYSFMQLPVRYNPSVQSANVDAFFRQLLPADAVAAWWEMVGYVFLPDCRFKRAAFCIGPQNSGKTTMMNLLIRFLGQYNTCAESLHNLCDEKYSTAALLHRLANIYPDLTSDEIKRPENLKGMVGGDRMRGEEKYKNAFYYDTTAKHFYSANAFVAARDLDVDAYIGRWLVFPMHTQFQFPEYAGDAGTANLTLIDELSTQDGLSEMLNLALEGLRRLLRQGSFTKSESMQAAQDEYRALLDSAYAFMLAATEKDADGFLSKQEVLARYKPWASGGDRHPLGEYRFFQRINRATRKLGLREGSKRLVRREDGTDRVVLTNGYYGRKWKDDFQTKTIVTLKSR